MTSTEIRWTRLILATIWLATGLITLFVYAKQDSMALLAKVGLTGVPAEIGFYGGAVTDIVFGMLTLYARGKWLWIMQALLIGIYTLIITIRLPEFWAHPFGPILKNLPILLLLWLLYKNERSAS